MKEKNAKLYQKLITKNAHISIIGLGYVGLPLLLALGKEGFSVTGIDIDNEKVTKLKQNTSYISDISNKELLDAINTIQNVNFTNKYDSIENSDAIIICVPTPLNKTKDPDISYIINATEQLAKYSLKSKLISVESTVYPGATEELILPTIIKQNPNLTVGNDFNLVFSPERVDPGQNYWNLKNTPKIVGGITKNCTDIGTALYGTLCNEVVQVSSARAAEMTKLLENTFRATNIGLVNEMAIISQKLDIDIWEIVEAAKTKPFGFMPFYPGPGLGGHCIPVDPRYLDWKLETLNSESKFIKLSEEINFSMPNFVVSRIKNIFENLNITNPKILILGLAYKPNVSDIRESPSIDIMTLLNEENIKFQYNDPMVKSIEIEGQIFKSQNIDSELLKNTDLAIISTDHSIYNWEYITNNLKYIFDTRNALRNVKKSKAKIFKL